MLLMWTRIPRNQANPVLPSLYILCKRKWGLIPPVPTHVNLWQLFQYSDTYLSLYIAILGSSSRADPQAICSECQDLIALVRGFFSVSTFWHCLPFCLKGHVLFINLWIHVHFLCLNWRFYLLLRWVFVGFCREAGLAWIVGREGWSSKRDNWKGEPFGESQVYQAGTLQNYGLPLWSSLGLDYWRPNRGGCRGPKGWLAGNPL